ncbi:DUF3237 family protein [Bradyrhizobium sp. B024]|uniref:DUF3237 family protein n=1 Tax=Bradyrhizobium sp. B024 TaxID=3140247 RepID=UPI003184210D
MTPTLDTKYVFTITARIGDVVTAGETGIGVRRIIPIIGGEVTGAVTGKVLPFGADFQTIRPNELIDLEAKYAFETADGAIVYVENKGRWADSSPTVIPSTPAAPLLRFTCANAAFRFSLSTTSSIDGPATAGRSRQTSAARASGSRAPALRASPSAPGLKFSST